MKNEYRDDILESDRRIFSALMNYSVLFTDSNKDWKRIKTIEKFESSIEKLDYKSKNAFNYLYEEGYYLTQIGEFELQKINETKIYPTIQSFVDEFLDSVFPYIDEHSNKIVNTAIEYAEQLKGSEYGIPYQISSMIENAKTHLHNLKLVKEQMMSLKKSASYNSATDINYPCNIDDVLKGIYRVGTSFIRNPQAYSKCGEEQLRSTIITALNILSDIDVTAESINRAGKTDIRVYSSSNKSVGLIAECKIWTGKEAIFPAIGQLLGYVTYNDVNACLIFFVKNKEFSNVLETAKREIPNYPNYTCTLENVNDQWIKYRFSRIDDKYTYFNMNVMLFHIPDIK